MGREAAATFPENEAYDSATDSWASFAPLPSPRDGVGVVAVGDAIYVLGGCPQPGDTRSNVVEIYTPSQLLTVSGLRASTIATVSTGEDAMHRGTVRC